jgi:hypothetical protein
MKDLSQFLRTASLGLFLGSLIFQTATSNAGGYAFIDKMTINEIAESLSRTYREINTQPEILQIFSRAEKEPEFRKDLLETMKIRYQSETIRIRCSNLTRSFRHLNATEMLPQLMKKWNEIEKKTEALEFGDLRIQLVITIAKFLPEAESVEFLIKTESDTAEAPIVRFRATVLLCASGNKKAIEHVLSVYEKAKKEFPATRMGNNPPLTRTESDTDGDWMSNYIENGLLLDPNNPDTDGDGLIDGNDRNPLCKPLEGKLSEDQAIAQFILYLHSRYYSVPLSPFKFKLLAVENTDNYDGTARPGLFANLPFTGIDGVILHLSREQILKLRTIHGREIDEIRLHKYPEEQKDIKKFHLSEIGRWFEMTFKNYNGIWLPTSWELTGMS